MKYFLNGWNEFLNGDTGSVPTPVQSLDSAKKGELVILLISLNNFEQEPRWRNATTWYTLC
ncbi:MAG: hypothetical protein A2428_13720 [Bdellovibrionales bacterium RIFOXYC1_FULL_54_43]|nr:MAG: hypothetical protein A2428_13720 [Bdellovibrionales bacterium RIFOXYC1_FULL_54_43]OFZ80006.1 MAG: hypothetical protein A2603_02215 [Bdellovibrionales bacterium RIFOXYD1_FULL_55_31]